MSLQGRAGGEAVFTAAVRPARAVYLIRRGSTSGFRRSVQEASTRWGGGCEPIVEVTADGTVSAEHRRVVELAGPDGAVNVDVPASGAREAAASLNLPLIPIAQIDRAGITAFSLADESTRPIPAIRGSDPIRPSGSCGGQGVSGPARTAAPAALSPDHEINASSAGSRPQSMSSSRSAVPEISATGSPGP
jgi:hypothetical protein